MLCRKSALRTNKRVMKTTIKLMETNFTKLNKR